MLVAVHLLRVLTGDAPKVIAMHSRRAHLSDDERTRYESFLGGPILLEATDAALELDPALAEAPVAKADPELEAYFRALLARAAEALVPTSPVVDSLREALREAIARGAPTIDDAARALGIGACTLQRRLAASGTTFAAVLDETRKAQAERLLARPELSITEVAFLLGYFEQASFFRAFRRWHRSTPAAFRRALR